MTTAPMKSHHGMHWSPETQLGRWTLGLAGFALAGTVALATAFAAGMHHADSFGEDWFLGVWGLAILGSGAAAAVTGVLAFVRAHDHAWWVVVGTVLGAVMTALMLQQVAEGLGWLGS